MMADAKKIQKIREYLAKNDFYSYKKNRAIIAKDITAEFREVSSIKNKRNLLLKSDWDSINALGKKRSMLVIELGGSFLNMFDTEITDNKTVKILKTKSVDFYNKRKLYTPDVLFREILKYLNGLIAEEKRQNIKDCVFIFTFPIEQYRRSNGSIDAKVIKINKKIKHRNIIGLKVGKSFELFAGKKGYRNINVSVTNDTITGLLASKYVEIRTKNKFDAALNIIVGTGANIAVGYDRNNEKNRRFYMVNTEFGYFKSFPMSKFDAIFNRRSDTRNESLAEKMISGLWQPHIFKIIVNEAVKDKILPLKTKQILKKIPMESSEIDRILNKGKINPEIRTLLDFIWTEQTLRGAVLCGTAVANFMVHILKITGLAKINFGLVEVGGVLEKARKFRKKMYQIIDSELARLDCTGKINYTKLNPDNKPALGAAVFNTIIRSNL